MAVISGYVVIRITVDSPTGAEADDVRDRVGTNCNYSLEYEDDDCKVVDTELLAVLDTCPGV